MPTVAKVAVAALSAMLMACGCKGKPPSGGTAAASERRSTAVGRAAASSQPGSGLYDGGVLDETDAAIDRSALSADASSAGSLSAGAGAVDAGPGAAADRTAPRSGVFCGCTVAPCGPGDPEARYCARGQYCCMEERGPSCDRVGGTCRGVSVLCMGAQDCASGKHCCALQGGESAQLSNVVCAPACGVEQADPGFFRICEHDAECQNLGARCLPTPRMSGLKSCQH